MTEEQGSAAAAQDVEAPQATELQPVQQLLPLVDEPPIAEVSSPAEEPSAGEAFEPELDAPAATAEVPAAEPEADAAGELTEEPVAETEGDDLDTAIAHAENLVGEPREPGESAAAETPAATASPGDLASDDTRQTAPLWPFLVYDAAWLAFSAATVYLLQQVPADMAAYESSVYPFTLIGGLVLTVAGPILLLTVWLVSRRRPGADSSALFFSALVRGSVATLVGVAMWWTALIVLDQLRLGRLF